MNAGRERVFNAASDKIRMIRNLTAEMCGALNSGRRYVSELCFAARSGKARVDSASEKMTEFGAIDAPIPVPIFGTGFAERRNRRIIAEKRKQKLCELKESIEYTKCEMNSAISNFNNVVEPKLIDYYIYKIQSEQNRYEQLLIEYKQLVGRNG